MYRGRVRAITGDGRVRVPLERARIAVAPAGKIEDPRGLTALRWHECTLPGTAASAMRAAGIWDFETKRNFDGEDWWWRIALDGAERGDWIDFEGVATLWDAWLDGEWVAQGDNMFVPRAIELEQPGKELVIRCRSIDAELGKKRPRPRWRVPMLEQQQLRWVRTTLLGRTPGWSPPCPPVGPWRAAWIGRRAHPVHDVAIDVRVEGGAGFVTCAADPGFDADACTLV